MQNFKFDVSVVIPVYNQEDHIRQCIKSLLRQTHPFSKIQIILINDGSEDNSEIQCNAFAKKHTNIEIISQTNQGVSAARNAGIKKAKGKYIMFVDADDEISETTVEALFDFYEEHFDEVDLVTYNLVYVNEKNEKSKHGRYNILRSSGVYDMDENIHIVQTTMNICVKNIENTIYFDTSLSMAEDQFYITEWIMRKHKIGYVDNADYFYYRHSAASSSSGNLHPYNCFDQMIYFFDGLCEKYKDHTGGPSRVVQALILYNLNWRLKSDLIYPHHLQGEEMEEAKEKVLTHIRRIDDLVILSSPYLDKFHKFCFLKLKGKEGKIYFAPHRFALCSGDYLWADEPYCEIVFTKTYVKDTKFILEGFLKTPAAEFYDVDIFAHKNNDKRGEKLSTVHSFYSTYKASVTTNNFLHFQYEVDLSETRRLYFHAEICGHKYKTKFHFAGISCFMQNKTSFIFGDYFVEMSKTLNDVNFDNFEFTRLSNKREIICAKKAIFKEHFTLSKGGVVYRSIIKKKPKPIWLYVDRHSVIDNAFYQFKNDFNKNDGVTRYYVTDNDDEKMKLFTKKEKKFLVEFGTLRHKVLFLNCSKILTSFHSISVYSPFPTVGLLAYYGDLTHYELVYLQHGILHASLVNLYAKERSTIDKVVVSSHFEIENFVKNYGYKKEDLITSGMPRYDYQKVESVPEKRILFSPSWRRNLIGNFVDNRRILTPNSFLNSPFYKQINEFLNSPRLEKLLEENDLTLDFKNHPIFEEYNEHYEIKNSRVNIISGSIEMDKYKLMITDYSSIVFDFVYLQRPVLYFVPDYEMFLSGLTHSYRELDLPLEEGFGAFTQNADELLNELEKLVEHNFAPEEKYQKRMDNFFITKENHCEKLYNHLIENS
ncbi:MAG TPA: glycosyltransferase [Clostridia bacterium]|nr:glycosyltransferase [Clostridia bacterium]